MGEAGTYSYDDFNRLMGSSCTSHCPDGQNTQAFSYSYDRFANRWKQTVTAGSGGTSSLTFTGGNNHIDGYSYEAAGNLLSDGSHTYYYDAEHHLVQVDGSAGWCQTQTGTQATACYTYDAEGRRVRRSVPGSGSTATGTASAAADGYVPGVSALVKDTVEGFAEPTKAAPTVAGLAGAIARTILDRL